MATKKNNQLESTNYFKRCVENELYTEMLEKSLEVLKSSVREDCRFLFECIKLLPEVKETPFYCLGVSLGKLSDRNFEMFFRGLGEKSLLDLKIHLINELRLRIKACVFDNEACSRENLYYQRFLESLDS